MNTLRPDEPTTYPHQSPAASHDGRRVGARRLRARLSEARLPVVHADAWPPAWLLPWLPAWLGGAGAVGDATDPTAPMFRRIRGLMTLLYTAVLVATLLLAGTILYVAADHRLMDPYYQDLRQSEQQATNLWASGLGGLAQNGVTPCDLLHGPDNHNSYTAFACYDAHGKLLVASDIAVAVPPFTNTTLVRQALASPTGCANDQITTSQDTSGGPPGFGVVLRGACVARNPTTNAVIGVVQFGEPVEDTVRALRQLLVLLFIVGGFTVVGSALGGFALSSRALYPARLAYTRQQRFIADVSHELRTPLTLMRADAEMLLRGREKLPPDDAELLDDIVDETARLATLTTSLLTLARLDSSTHLPEREPVDLGAVATGAARRTQALAEKRGVTVTVEAPAAGTPGAPGEALTLGARDLLDQAALILVDNAIKYNTPGGRVDIRVERRAGDRLALVVRDDGPGVTPEQLPHLGERFYRTDKARSRLPGQEGGAGLGLAIARGVASAHGGALTFASGAPVGAAPGGVGLTATLELPAARLREGVTGA